MKKKGGSFDLGKDEEKEKRKSNKVGKNSEERRGVSKKEGRLARGELEGSFPFGFEEKKGLGCFFCFGLRERED